MTTSLRAPLQERLNSLFASHPDELTDPYPVYRELAESGPVVAWGPTLLVTRYADVKPLLRDGVRYSNGYRAEGSLHEHTRSKLAGAYRDALDEVTWFEAMYMSRADGDVHKRLREMRIGRLLRGVSPNSARPHSATSTTSSTAAQVSRSPI